MDIVIDKKTRKAIIKCIFLLILSCFIPKVALFYVICGILDLRRNDALSLRTIKRYFLGNGLFSWLLSPINLAVDLVCYRNRGVYDLAALPVGHQKEIQELLALANDRKQEIIDMLKEKIEGKSKGMIFFKWYGKTLRDFLGIDLSGHHFNCIKTVGISIFNKNQSTAEHFGPLRLTLRVLYNLTPVNHHDVYIKVGPQKHWWHDSPLFIFDDTLMHQSVNGTDEIRYCMFLDIVRPNYCAAFLNGAVKCVQVLLLKSNGIFYKRWDILS